MAWWEGVEETRVLIAPVAEPTTKEIGEKGRLLTLRHPKAGSSTRYFLNGGTLQELNWFKQSYGSWFLGEYACQEIGSSKFFRLNDSKVLAWLCHKVHQLKLTLPTLDKNYAAQDEKDMLREVVPMLGEYLKDEPWVKLLCNHLKLDLQEAAKRTMVQEFLPSAPNSTSGSSNSLQSKTASQKKTPGKQAKKMKTENDSRNIRDMFTRASRRGS